MQLVLYLCGKVNRSSKLFVTELEVGISLKEGTTQKLNVVKNLGVRKISVDQKLLNSSTI